MPKYFRYFADVPDKARAVALSIDYATWAGNPVTWSAWTMSDDTSKALRDAGDHVSKFKRCRAVQGGSASVPQPGGRYL